MRRRPSPWHASQRPPFTLKLKRPGLYPRSRDSGSMRVEFANRRKHARVRRGIRARRAPDRRLIDLNHLVDVLDARDRAMRSRLFHRAIEFRRQRAIQNVVHQRRFARAGNAASPRSAGRAESSRRYFSDCCRARPGSSATLPFGLRRSAGTGSSSAPKDIAR